MRPLGSRCRKGGRGDHHNGFSSQGRERLFFIIASSRTVDSGMPVDDDRCLAAMLPVHVLLPVVTKPRRRLASALIIEGAHGGS